MFFRLVSILKHLKNQNLKKVIIKRKNWDDKLPILM